MTLHLTFLQPSAALWQSPILIAAVLTFTGVLLTVVIGTIANFRLAKARSEFDRELATQKLEDERQARAEARSTNLRLRRIDFQRAALVELQECMLTLMRHANFAFTAEATDANNTEALRANNAKSALLISRIENRKLAEEAGELKRVINGKASTTENERRNELNEASLGMVEFLKDVGEEIRRLDRDEEKEAGN